MPRHDFRALYAQYPSLIIQMPDAFTSHAFVMQLARAHQALYVEALSGYADCHHRGKPAPFMIVHGILSRRLAKYPHLIRCCGQVMSRDMFGRTRRCALWEKQPLMLYPFPALDGPLRTVSPGQVANGEPLTLPNLQEPLNGDER
jgi:hypothetical protein